MRSIVRYTDFHRGGNREFNSECAMQKGFHSSAIRSHSGAMSALDNLAKGFADLAGGNFDTRIPVTGEGQIAQLEQAFNELAELVRVAKQEQVEFQKTLEEDNRNWKERLEAAFEETNALKLQQDGDYFLTSLLTTPLAANNAASANINVEIFLEQKKKFEFRQWRKDLGGDTCIVSNITLKGRQFTVFLNADAMGKSMQGAGGILVLGSVFHSVLERTRLSPSAQDVFPEQWLKYTFIELHRVFEVFDGSMLVSLVMGLVDDNSGLVYFLNAEHPPLVLYRSGKAEFIADQVYLRKLGTLGMEGQIGISTFSMLPGDVVIAGSDGRDDLLLGFDDQDGNRIFNADFSLFLRVVEDAGGQLSAIREILSRHGDITDDLSFVRMEFVGAKNFDRPDVTARVGDMLSSAAHALKNNHTEAAIALLEEAYDFEPEQPPVMQNLVRAYLQNKQYSKAAWLAEEYLQVEPGNSAFLYLASHCYKQLGDLRNAADLGERLLLRDRSFVKNLLNLAEIYFLQGNYKRSRLMASDAEKIDPGNAKAIRLVAALDARG